MSVVQVRSYQVFTVDGKSLGFFTLENMNATEEEFQSRLIHFLNQSKTKGDYKIFQVKELKGDYYVYQNE